MVGIDEFFLQAFAPEHRRDPYPLYREFSETLPPLAASEAGLWLTFRHDLVAAILRHPHGSSDERRGTLVQRMMVEDPAIRARLEENNRSLLFMDPPDHTRLRSLVAKAFTPATVERLRPAMEAMVAELVDEVAVAAKEGPVDLITQFAYPFPLRVICELLGVPYADRARFDGWSKALVRGVDPKVLRSDEVEQAMVDAGAALDAYLVDLFEERRRHPGGDLLSALLVVEEAGERLSQDELLSLAGLLLLAGHETTVNLIGNGMAALLAHLDQLALLAATGVDRRAVDELLRYDSPVQMNQRVAGGPMEVAGHTIPEGDQIVLILAAANRDPSVYDQPDRLDVTRNGPAHVAFGGGIHHCLGAALARTEAQLALDGLLKRFSHIEQAGETTLRPTFTLRGLETFPVTLRERSSASVTRP